MLAGMTDEILLYYNPRSRARTAHWMLEELGVPYRIELIRLDKREHKSEAFLAINPMGKLPALVHRGVAVTEAAAICAYLADAFPAAGLAPALDDPARGSYYRWMFFGASCIETALVDRMLARPPSDQPGRLGYGTYEDTMRTFEDALTPGPFLLGERFTAADVFVGSLLEFGIMSKAIAPEAGFVAYQERLQARPAHQRFLKQTQEITEQLVAQA